MDKFRIVSGPTFQPVPQVWEVVVALPVYSPKLASKAYDALPDTLDVSGVTYYKAGMHADDCTAWYRTRKA